MSKTKYTKGKNLTQEDFDQIKLLLNNTTLGKSKIADIVNRSAGTISSIARYETLEEMRKANLESRKKYYKDDKPTPNYGVAADAINSIVEKQRTTNSVSDGSVEALVRIGDIMERQAIAMERLASAWEKPTKKRIF